MIYTNRTNTSFKNNVEYKRFQKYCNKKKQTMVRYIQTTFKRLNMKRNDIEVKLIMDKLTYNTSKLTLRKPGTLKSVLHDIYHCVKKGEVLKLFVDREYYILTHCKDTLSVVDEYINEIIETVIRNGGDIVLASFGFDAKVAAYINK